MKTSPVLPLYALPEQELIAPLAGIVRQYADVGSEADYEKVTLMALDTAARLARTLPLEWVRAEIGPILDRVVANSNLTVHDRICAAGLSIWCHWNTKGAVDYLGSCLVLEDEPWRMEATDILGQCPRDAVPHIPAMLERLASGSEPERLGIVKALERMGLHAVHAAAALTAHCRVEKSAKVREAIVAAANTIGVQHFVGLEDEINPPVTLAEVAAQFGRRPPGSGLGVALLRWTPNADFARSKVNELLALVRGGERETRFVEPAAQYLFNLGADAAADIANALRDETDNTARIVLMLAVGKHAAVDNTAVDDTLPLLIANLSRDMFGCMNEVCWAADAALDAFGVRAVPALKQAAFGEGELQLQALQKLALMRQAAINAKLAR